MTYALVLIMHNIIELFLRLCHPDQAPEQRHDPYVSRLFGTTFQFLKAPLFKFMLIELYVLVVWRYGNTRSHSEHGSET